MEMIGVDEKDFLWFVQKFYYGREVQIPNYLNDKTNCKTVSTSDMRIGLGQ